MSEYPIHFLAGNPALDEIELEDERRDDARQQPRPSGALPDSPDLEREMAEAFGWDIDPTEAEMEEQYAATKCDEADLLARHRGLAVAPDEFLIGLIADPGDREGADERAAAAAILLERRLGSTGPRKAA